MWQERGGSSRLAILKYITKKYQLGQDEKLVNAHLKMALRSGIKSGLLKQSKGTGAAGSFRIGAEKQTKPGKKPKAAGSKKPKVAKKPKAAGKAKKTAAAGEAKVKKPKVAKKPKSPTKTAKPAAAKKPVAAKAVKSKAPKAQKSTAAKSKKAAAKKWIVYVQFLLTGL